MRAKMSLTMGQLRQMLRLARDGTSSREIGRFTGVAKSTVQDALKHAEAAGLSWSLPPELTNWCWGRGSSRTVAAELAWGACPRPTGHGWL